MLLHLRTTAHARSLQMQPAKGNALHHLNRSSREHRPSGFTISCLRGSNVFALRNIKPHAEAAEATILTTAKASTESVAAATALPFTRVPRGGLAAIALAVALNLPVPVPVPVPGLMAAPAAHAAVEYVSAGALAAPPAAVAAGGGGADGVLPPREGGTETAASGLQTVYFGNGCFWGRQKDFVDVELQQLGRAPEQLTALAGYAAGTKTGPGGKVCYVYSDPRTRYDSLGHAEVVQLGVSADPRVAETEMRAFAARYFQQFKKTPGGMQRSDPQDKGAAYRNVIGIPGGVNSPLFHIVQEENKYNMELREGRGNAMGWGGPTEDDILNTVWVVDSSQLPFFRAERYHQFHHGLGKLFSQDYVRDLRGIIAGLGRIDPTGCPELPY